MRFDLYEGDKLIAASAETRERPSIGETLVMGDGREAEVVEIRHPVHGGRARLVIKGEPQPPRVAKPAAEKRKPPRVLTKYAKK